jgi:uncharacterized phiE125 gp8 family phage protein
MFEFAAQAPRWPRKAATGALMAPPLRHEGLFFSPSVSFALPRSEDTSPAARFARAREADLCEPIMSLQLNTPPAAEPVTLDQAKAWLRIETGDDDALISSLVSAARARAEWHTGRAFVTQGWTLWLDEWREPCAEIPLPPLQGVSSVTFYARDDSATILDAGDYTVDSASQPGRVMLTPGGALANLRAINAVAIAFTAGYGAADAVPGAICQAILEIVAMLYAHRGDDAAPTPDAALALLAPYRLVKL